MRSKSWIHEAHGGIRDKNELKRPDITLDPAG
jgi:hypothetical protein